MGCGVVLTLHQAQPTSQGGDTAYVVPWIYKNRIIYSPLWQRCLVVGLGAGLFGFAIGHRLGRGGGIVAAAVGAVLGLCLAHYFSHLIFTPNMFGTAGELSRETTLLFGCLLGAAMGAEASMRVRRRHKTWTG